MTFTVIPADLVLLVINVAMLAWGFGTIGCIIGSDGSHKRWMGIVEDWKKIAFDAREDQRVLNETYKEMRTQERIQAMLIQVQRSYIKELEKKYGHLRCPSVYSGEPRPDGLECLPGDGDREGPA